MEQTADRRYYISLRGRQAGPFTHDELRLQPLRRNTPVWNEDQWAWTDADAIHALIDLFGRAKRSARKHQRSFWAWLGFGRRKG